MLEAIDSKNAPSKPHSASDSSKCLNSPVTWFQSFPVGLLDFCLSFAQYYLSLNKLLSLAWTHLGAGAGAIPSYFLSCRVTLYICKKSRDLKYVGFRAHFQLFFSVSDLRVHALNLLRLGCLIEPGFFSSQPKLISALSLLAIDK